MKGIKCPEEIDKMMWANASTPVEWGCSAKFDMHKQRGAHYY